MYLNLVLFLLDYFVVCQVQEEMERLSDVQNLVMQLYEALHVGEHQVKKERHLMARLEQLQTQLLPMEQVNNHTKHYTTTWLRKAKKKDRQTLCWLHQQTGCLLFSSFLFFARIAWEIEKNLFVYSPERLIGFSAIHFSTLF